MRKGRGAGALGAVLTLLVLGGSARAEEFGGRPPRVAPPLVAAAVADDHETADAQTSTEQGRAALAEASTAKQAAQKLEGDDREQALLAVVGRYDAIAAGQGHAVPECTEAAFRAGEILRALKQVELADARFERAVTMGEGVEEAREFAARALLERAHILRRMDDGEGALSLYAEVGRRFADQRRAAAHARTWTGKLQLRSGQLELGAEVLQGFAEAYPEYATEAVRNADTVAVAWFEAGDEPAARVTLAWIRGRMEPLLAEGGRQAEKIRAALDRMRVTALLSGD